METGHTHKMPIAEQMKEFNDHLPEERHGRYLVNVFGPEKKIASVIMGSNNNIVREGPEERIYIDQPTDEEYERLLSAGLVNEQYAAIRWLNEHGFTEVAYDEEGLLWISLEYRDKKLEEFPKFMNKYFPKT